MKQKFPHLTSQIKGKTLKDQPISNPDADYNKDFHILVFNDGYYSVNGLSKDEHSTCLLHEEDLTEEIEKTIKEAVKFNLIPKK